MSGENQESSRNPSKFKPKSYFLPPIQNAAINTFVKKVNYDVELLFKEDIKPSKKNLTRKEQDALISLSTNKDLVIKPADKGGAVVIWSRDLYIEEAYRQLKNEDFYQHLRNDPTETMKKELLSLLTDAREKSWITDNEFKFLYVKNPRIACFYMLPKIHKYLNKPPGRPFISNNGSLLEQCSQYIDYFIKPLVPTLPAFIQDTTDAIKKIKDIGSVDSASLLGFMDVEALYTNINHDEGLRALRYYLTSGLMDESPPAEFILTLTEWTLKHNVFVFEDNFFQQVKGTTMGACFAPNYANLFLGQWEEEYV